LTSRQAVLLGGVFQSRRRSLGDAVAKTVGAGLVDITYVTTLTSSARCSPASCGFADVWLGLPTSSSHALNRGLIGAAVAQRARTGM